MPFLLFFVGLALLVVGAELLVRGASRLGSSLGVAPLVIGLTVVAWATTAPELAVNIQATTQGVPGVALGNVVGSNIFNILVILGLSALVAPLIVVRQIVRREVPLMIGASSLLLILSLDSNINRIDGLIFVTGMAGYTGWSIWLMRGEAVLATDETRQLIRQVRRTRRTVALTSS
jgi:cation:H+ antiporter